jgi:Ca2+-binding RTX toxin-like protein
MPVSRRSPAIPGTVASRRRAEAGRVVRCVSRMGAHRSAMWLGADFAGERGMAGIVQQPDLFILDPSEVSLGHRAGGGGTVAAPITAKVGIVFPGDDLLDDAKDGTADDDTLNGLGGNDTLNGLAGNDKIDGGADNDVLLGGTGSDTLTGGAGNDELGTSDVADGAADTLTGGAGNDIYYVYETQDKVVESAPGDTNDTVISGITFSLAALANIENLTLRGFSGYEALAGTGNAAKNTMEGNNGDNILDGGKAIDIFVGHDGDDTFILDDASEANTANVIEAPGEGTDTVKTAIAGIANAIDNVENYIFTGAAAWTFTGNDLANAITGAGGNDTLSGGKGDDVLNGGGGIDKMTGGDGNDTFFVDNLKDSIVEAGFGGTDTVVSTLSIDLGAGTFATSELENVTLIGSAANATGTAGKNALIGNDAANTLDGAAGDDRMAGGKGNDFYVIDAAGDRVFELAGEGTDTVTTSIDLDFSGFALNRAVENFVLTGSADEVDGNGLDNTITGNAGLTNTLSGHDGNDKLNGGTFSDQLFGGAGNDTLVAGDNLSDSLSTLDGGAGNDTLTGGKGNDQFIVDSAGDKVIETVKSMGVGFNDEDEVVASINFSLASLANIERLTFNAFGDFKGTGNAAANRITAVAGDNVLDGGAGNDELAGGDGNDTLIGGTGIDTFDGGADNDTYVLDDFAEFGNITELDGSDTIKSSLLFDESGFVTGVENYVYTGTGKFVFNGSLLTGIESVTGGSGSDTLTANAAGTRLDGGGGADSLVGGAGGDVFVVDNVGDKISDSGGVNTLIINRSIDLTTPLSKATDQQFVGVIRHVTLTGTAALNATGDLEINGLYGNDGANKLDGVAGKDILVGGKGNDTYFIHGEGETVTEAAGQGIDTVVTDNGNVDLEFDDGLSGSEIENVTATAAAGAAILGGNALANVLTGNDSDNALDGRTGDDTMIGGKGGDDYVVDSLGDKVVETLTQAAGGGVDTVFGLVSFSLANLANVENLTLIGGNIDGTGNGGVNVLSGTNGDNILDGGLNSDFYSGADGNDTFVFDEISEFSQFADTSGNDTIRSSVLFTTAQISASIENYVYTGSAKFSFDVSGVATINSVTGGSGADTITGHGGGMKLDGGAGADKLSGGAGDDTFVVDNVGDTITDAGGSGDSLIINRSVNLAAPIIAADKQFVGVIENVALTGTAALNITGDAGFNTLAGNGGANVMDGNGGADTLIGGSGNDTYIYRAEGEDIVELDKGGIDTVRVVSGGTFDLGSFASGAFVENIAVFSVTGMPAVSFIGNALDNVLTGGDGDDSLDGGLGADTLIGGKGNDTYTVADTHAKIVETVAGAAGGSADTVISQVDFSLASFANVENLNLAGLDDIDGTGNSLANTLSGNVGNNVLDGGAGIDTYGGGFGDDTYILDSAAEVVLEGTNWGSDTVVANFLIDNTLLANYVEIENFTYTGAKAWTLDLSSRTGDDHRMIGGSGADTLTTADGLDFLDGGKGNDIMRGGLGDDTYVVDSLGDVVDEESNADANDTVMINRSVNLLSDFGGAIENVTLTGNAAINATGNFANNVMQGNDGNNVLVGGVGSDTLIGGKGDDTLRGGGNNDSDTDTFAYLALTDRGTGKEVIKDFKVGAGGDVIDVSKLLIALSYNGTDPFADGFVALVDDGKGNTILMVDADGAGDDSGFVTLVTLENAALTSADTANFLF